jgi:hypothetical protein
MPDKSFGDISHDRDSRSLNLPTKTKVLLPSLVPAYRFVDLPRQLSGFFPAIEILKSGELHFLVCLVGLVCLVYLATVYLVEEVYSVFLVN